MAFKGLHVWVAVAGIAAASAGGWWWQNRAPVKTPDASAPAASGAGKSAAPTAGPSSPPRAAGVEVAKVERATLRDEAQAVGTLRSRQNTVLRPEVSGRISQLGFADGARVRKGQLLVKLDDALPAAELKQAQAQVSIARANLKRNQELVAQNFVAQRVLEESQATVQVAEAQLALAEARLQRMSIVAPFDGTVGIRSVNIGDFVKDGADLVNLEDIGSLYVDFRVPERFLARIRRGQSVEVQLDAFPGRSFQATVDAVDPLVDANGRSVGIRAVLPNTAGVPQLQPTAKPPASAGAPAAQAGKPPAQSAKGADRPNTPRAGAGAGVGAGAEAGPLRPGMFARATVVFAVRDSALTVPEEAIVPQGGRQFVIKVVPADTLSAEAQAKLPKDTTTVSQRVEVKLGVRRPGRVEVLDGVAEGDTVVVAGQQRLQRDGSAVRVIDMSRPPGPPPSGAPAAVPTTPAAR
ncbi:MAG TPA: efflux RND transporter periplasmic adaptor subunit [Burkholderiaceae bacterium]|nr:efflux RND transporter periplasmic adaptor subunit [Burkholderiaceae bacterium]